MPTQYLSALTDTWNNAATVWNGIKMNVTGTAYAAASRLFSLELTGAEKFAVTPDGAALTGPGTAALPALSFIADPDTGFYRVGANQLGFSVGGTLRATFNTTDLTMGSGIEILGDYGTAALPGYAFAGDPNTGIYRPASDAVGVATGGVLRATFSDATLTMGAGVEILGDSGTAALPGYAFSGDQDTGMYSYGANVLGFSAGAGWIMRMDAEGLKFNTGKQVLTSSGEVALPTLSFLTDADTGIYNPATNTLGIVNGGTEYSRISSSGSHRFGELTTDNVGTSGTAGLSLSPLGNLQIARDNSVFTGNRTDGDGTLCSFRRIGTQVGSISVSSGATAYNTSSDYRLKDIEDQPEGYDVWARIEELDAALTWFTWKAFPELGLQFGALAHVFQEVAPYAVSGEKDAVDPETGEIDPQGVDWSKNVPELIAGLAAAMRRINVLEARIIELEAAQ
jgi:hypothetical protein